MNIAFPAFFLLVLILPGFIFLNAFERRENTSLDKKPFEASSASALVMAGLMHASLSSITHCFIRPIDFAICVRLLTGGELVEQELINLSEDVIYITSYFIIVFLVSHIVGKLTQVIVLYLNPYKSSRYAFDTPWYYELKGKLSEESDAEIIKLSCLEGSNEGVYLYYGYLEDFYLDNNGQLDRLVLSDVYRRHIKDDDGATKNKARYYQVKGDRLVLKYKNIRNINIEYLYISELP